MMLFFIILQLSLLAFITLHDWIDLPPYTDIAALKQSHTERWRMMSTAINGSFILLTLILTTVYMLYPKSFGIKMSIFLIYLLLTYGTLLFWWVPYIFGSSAEHKFNTREYENTHHFLPPIGTNVTPNTVHVVLHLQIWLCLLLSLYILLQR